MKVILLERVENIGDAGEVVDVQDGYARNFLFPRGLAANVTERRVEDAAQRRARVAEEARVALDVVQKQVAAVDGNTILIQKPIGPDGVLHGSVSARDIADEIHRAFSVTLPKGALKLREPIRGVGEKPVHLEFPHGLEADVIVVVEGKPMLTGKTKDRTTKRGEA